MLCNHTYPYVRQKRILAFGASCSPHHHHAVHHCTCHSESWLSTADIISSTVSDTEFPRPLSNGRQAHVQYHADAVPDSRANDHHKGKLKVIQISTRCRCCAQLTSCSSPGATCVRACRCSCFAGPSTPGMLANANMHAQQHIDCNWDNAG